VGVGEGVRSLVTYGVKISGEGAGREIFLRVEGVFANMSLHPETFVCSQNFWV
jgi:hypothetical protein